QSEPAYSDAQAARTRNGEGILSACGGLINRLVILGFPMLRVRFAPSPTGFLHIGSARTFIFNWLYARHQGGAMILRIDDTDVERNTQTSLDSIFDGLNWLGLGWDELYH